MLDYILVNDKLIRQLRSYEILEEGTFSSTSDHLPIIMTLELSNIDYVHLDQYSKLPAWHSITDADIKQYQSCFLAYACGTEVVHRPLTTLLHRVLFCASLTISRHLYPAASISAWTFLLHV